MSIKEYVFLPALEAMGVVRLCYTMVGRDGLFTILLCVARLQFHFVQSCSDHIMRVALVIRVLLTLDVTKDSSISDASEVNNTSAGDITEAPKFPPSSYQLFVQATRPLISGTLSNVAMQLSGRWSGLDPAVKEKYEDYAKELKALYDRDLAKYKASASYQKNLDQLRMKGVRC